MVITKHKKGVLAWGSFFLTFSCVYAEVENISLFGRTGLIENPSAYVLEDGHISIGLSHLYPYSRFYINTGFVPRLEIGGVITQVENIRFTSGVWKDYGKYKDKAFFAKLQLIKEDEKVPAVAIGYDDFHGTRLFQSLYIVSTKYIDYIVPQIFSVGYSKGKMDGLFLGTEILVHPKLTFMLEYSPLDTKNMIGFNRKNMKSEDKINLGVRYSPNKFFQTNLIYGRDNIGLNFAFSFKMGEGIPRASKYFIMSEDDIKLIKENKQEQFYIQALNRLELKNSYVYIEDRKLIIEYDNRGYLFESIALRKVIDILKFLYFPDIEYVEVVIKNQNLPITSYIFKAEDINNYLKGKKSLQELLRHSDYTISADHKVNSPQSYKTQFTFSPKLRTFLNDPSGAFKYEASLDFGLKQYISNKLFLTGNLTFPFYNNISTVNKPLMENPVRSDIAEYISGTETRLKNLSLNYITGVFKNTFLGLSAGYNELMFSGIGGDLIYFFKDGRLALGIGGDYVYKRDKNSLFDINCNKAFYDYYLSSYYSLDFPQINLSLKVGRFLAGDKGVRIEVSREINGFELGFWYTKTDSSKFSGDNKGYSDKGVFITVPLRMFSIRDNSQVARFSLSPWTRDVGQLANRPVDLHKTIKHKLPFYILDNINASE